MTNRQAMCLAVICIALCLLTGCLGTRQTETGAASGVIAGQPMVVKWTRDTEGHTSVELPPELMSAVGAAAGATPWGALIAGGVSIAAAAIAGRQTGVAKVQSQRAEEHKADAAEGWSE